MEDLYATRCINDEIERYTMDMKDWPNIYKGCSENNAQASSTEKVWDSGMKFDWCWSLIDVEVWLVLKSDLCWSLTGAACFAG